MPLRDPIQPRLIDHTQLYLQLSLPDVADPREILLQKMSMTTTMRHRAMQKLTLLGMYNQDGTITSLGKFAAELGSEPENAALLWCANEFQVMEDALTIFALLERGPSFTTREQRIKVPHPDGDMHSLVNVWNHFQWLDQRTNTLSKEDKERIWSKEHISFRSYQTVGDFRKEVGDRCKHQFGNWSTDGDETYSTRLALALLKAYKLTLMIRGAVGNCTSVTDNDEWRFGSMESRSSLIKFSPQFLIAPGRMVRMMSMGTKPADMRIDLAMGVPLEFLASEMWFCTNCCRNSLFIKVLDEVRKLPILSNMTIMERLCPAFGVCPVPFTRNAGAVDPDTAKEYMQPMKWIYDRPAKVLHEYAQKYARKYRVDIPIRVTELKVSADLIVPGLKVDLYTMNFADASERPGGEDMVVRADGWTVGNHLWIIPPCENDTALRQRWLRSVAPFPTTELAYRERLAFSGTHDKVDQDIIEPGGDTGDMEAAFAEMDQEKPKEPKDTSFGQAHIQCSPSVYDDERGNISDVFRPMMKCALCQKDPTRISDTAYEARKFYSMTSHVTFQHDACVYPSSRGFTYQQLVGGRQAWRSKILDDQCYCRPNKGKPIWRQSTYLVRKKVD